MALAESTALDGKEEKMRLMSRMREFPLGAWDQGEHLLIRYDNRTFFSLRGNRHSGTSRTQVLPVWMHEPSEWIPFWAC